MSEGIWGHGRGDWDVWDEPVPTVVEQMPAGILADTRATFGLPPGKNLLDWLIARVSLPMPPGASDANLRENNAQRALLFGLKRAAGDPDRPPLDVMRAALEAPAADSLINPSETHPT